MKKLIIYWEKIAISWVKKIILQKNDNLNNKNIYLKVFMD
jgi:hypothetical protein